MTHVRKDHRRADIGASQVFGFSDAHVIGVDHQPDAIHLTVEYYGCAVAREQGGPCPGCHVKDRRAKRPVAHVPLDRPLIVTPVEIRLDHPGCIPPRAPAPFIVERWGMTEVAVKWALKAAMSRTFTSVETAMGVTPGKVSTLYHAVEPQIAAFVPPTAPRCLGLDGVHLLKKTFTMVAVLDRGGNWVFDFLATHKPEHVEARLKEIIAPDAVVWVALDPSSSLRAVMRRLFPKVKIIVDKRHVIKLAVDCANAVRIANPGEYDGYGKEGDEAPAIKLAKQVMETPSHRLSKEQRQLLAVAPDLVQLAYQAKESFAHIYHHGTPEGAERAVDAWWGALDHRLRDFFRSLHKLASHTWKREFLAYFAHRQAEGTAGAEGWGLTTGFVESANRILKAYADDARGRITPARLRAMMLYRYGTLTDADLDAMVTRLL